VGSIRAATDGEGAFLLVGPCGLQAGGQ